MTTTMDLQSIQRRLDVLVDVRTNYGLTRTEQSEYERLIEDEATLLAHRRPVLV